MDKTDEQLIEDYQSGDRSALSVIFERYKIRILNFCFHLLGNRADAEDISADVFVFLLDSHSAFDPQKARFSTWIYTVARNKSVSRIRSRNRLVLAWFPSEDNDGFGSFDPAQTDDLPVDKLLAKETAAHVSRAIAKLPQEQREALTLRQYHDFTYEQISQILGFSLEKVKILIFRAKERLRIELASFVKEDLT